ncbi:hypothetical protein RXV95_07570 [Novosphingobium sp. ZN18A2]|uniref:hypothetical protein n=1 Tax=Novosphingobium sp. ZN18A2 TaxID=3079861 RepID=UPI0030CF6352
MRFVAASAALAALALAGTASAQTAGTPTCSDVDGLYVDVHGQHVIRDYVAGGTLTDPSWPPSDVGSTVSDNGGAAVPGGPGPGFHFLYEVPPGASFCTDSQSGRIYEHLPEIHQP